MSDTPLQPYVGNQILELKKLEKEGVTNISFSEMRCLELLRNENASKYISCLPDLQENVFGRADAIAHIIHLIQAEEKPCVVLTGGAGFGKTTTAIQAAHKILDAKSDKAVIYFVRLRDLRSLKEVCREVLSTIGRRSKDGEEKEELMYWAKSFDKEVILILDNAEDILNAGNSVGDEFRKLLEKLRTVNRHLQFVVTSRERFEVGQMEVVCHEIDELKNDEGVEVIRSLTSKTDLRDDDVKTIASLCGGIPLALTLIGPIIDGYDDVQQLIEDFEKYPMEILEDSTTPPSYHRSLRAAFECSFNKLDESKKTKLVCLSVFRGSFEEPAVSCIWQERKFVTVKMLKEFTDKSLLQKRSLTRYELHPLVQKYLTDEKGDDYKEDIDTTTNKFIAYYISGIMKGNEMFWSKDNFIKSIDMWKVDDNLNNEKALEICHKNAERMRDCFSNLWSVSIYLGMVTSFENLTKFVRVCLDSAVDQKEKGAEMEARCLIAFYESKKGNSEQLKTHMNKAMTLYKHKKSLNESQEWFFKQTHGFVLNEERKYNKALKTTMEALQLAESHPDNTDLAMTLGQLGIIEKRYKHYEEANNWLTKSYNKRQESLGENHILSVPKHLADLYLEQNRYPEALKLYEEGYATYKALEMHQSKQCINLLKNIGGCYRELQQVNEAEKSFLDAIDISERHLDGDHKLKVELFSEMAKLHSQSPDPTILHTVMQQMRLKWENDYN